MKLLHRLWADEAGFIISAELVLVATILVIGLIVGMAELRNQIVQELADVSQAIGWIDQGYEYMGISKADVGNTSGSVYDDVADFCQAAQSPGDPPAGISLSYPPDDGGASGSATTNVVGEAL